MKKTLIVAETFDMFKEWCAVQGVTVDDPEVLFVSTEIDLRGKDASNSEVVFLGEWEQREDSDLIIQALQMSGLL